ncbi:hypothetical protein BH10ACT2_BH10ACT2_07780 [soil metagenome]
MRQAWSEIDHISPSPRRRYKHAAAFGAALVLVLAACGDDDDANTSGGTEAPAGPVVKVHVKEFTLTSDKSEVPAGKITIEGTNDGTIEHEIIIFKTDIAEGELPIVDGRVPEDDPALTVVDEVSEFEAGTTSSGTFDLAAGRYLLICNIPAHYGQGMHTVLTVTG